MRGVVSARPPAAPSDHIPSPTPEQLLAALDGRIAPVKVGKGYQFGLLAVTCVMLLLPVVYLALIGIIVWAVGWHVVNDISVFQATGGNSIRVALVVYLLPMAVGILLIVFMIKPLFARRAQSTTPFTLSRSEQRHLYTFVDKLCTLVGAPKPYRIDVDCQVNASASFRDGLRGLLTGQLVLTIGLPLAAGMNARQLTGVLAHEFGHFAQGTGMRLTFVVRYINAWFARVVYERDAWDEWLRTVDRSDPHWAITIVAWTARAMVWLTRRTLWLLMWVAHFFSSLMLRQMEFDADRYEARVAGSAMFEKTSERVQMLAAARNAAFSDLADAWRERRLCDDLPALIQQREIAMPLDVRVAFRKHIADSKTRWFDSHPSDSSRIQSARRESSEGLFRIEAPAAVLFDDFPNLARRVTERYYRDTLGDQFRPDQMVTTDTLVANTGEKEKANQSLNRFFQGLIDPLRPVFPRGTTSVPAKPDEAAELLLAARTRLLQNAPQWRTAVSHFSTMDDRAVNAMRALSMRQAGVTERGMAQAQQALKIPCDEASLRKLQRESQSERSRSVEGLNSVIMDAMQRIDIVLALGEQEQKKAAKVVDVDGSGAYELNTALDSPRDRIFTALATLSAAAAGTEQMRQAFYALGSVLALCKSDNNPPQLINMVIERAKTLHKYLTDTHAILRTTPYPYEHNDTGVSLSRFALEKIPPTDEIGAIYRAAESTLSAIYGLYVRLMSDLAHRAEELERSLGLDPLPEVKPLVPAAAGNP